MGYIPTFKQIGTTTNDSAAAGDVGEVVTGQLLAASANGLATTVLEDILSISLTAGDWDVGGTAVWIPAATTSVTLLNAAISLTSATLDSENRLIQWKQAAAVPGASAIALALPTCRISVAVTTTVYLVMGATFTVSTLTACGSLFARRAR